MTRARLLRGTKEIVLILLVYGAYSLVRNLMGNDVSVAERNAHWIVDAERALMIFHEKTIQGWFDHRWLMQPLNAFYGIAHFAVTGGLMLWLYLRRHTAYPRLRNAIMLMSGAALVGYVTFPLAPPRLMPEYGIFDALERFGSPWTYENSAVGAISNQYAAMPSLHIGWALWCSWVLWTQLPVLRVRVIAVVYSALAMLAVVATGNHYILDGVGGLVVLMIGALGAKAISSPVPEMEPALEGVVAAVDRDHVTGVVRARPGREVDGDAAEVLG